MKTIAIGTKLRLVLRLHILSEPLYLLGSPLQHPGPGAFIRLLGRHALPHQFHRQDTAKFMKAGRRATAAVTQLYLPSHDPISMWWVGLESSPYIMYCSFMGTCTGQLNHSNPLVRVSTRHGLLQPKQRFHPSKPCLATTVPQKCLSHADDHSCFLVLCHRVCLEVHVPEEPLHVPTVFHPMHLCVHEWQTDDVHSWMDASYPSLSDAVG